MITDPCLSPPTVTVTPRKVGEAAHSSVPVQWVSEYSSSDSCRVIHCGQCHLSPDVSVGRAEKLINGDEGETARMKISQLKRERSHSVSLTLKKYTGLYGTSVPSLYSWKILNMGCKYYFMKCTVVLSHALPVQSFDLVWVACPCTHSHKHWIHFVQPRRHMELGNTP